VARLARFERVDQYEYFELFTFAETPKMAEIRNVQHFDAIFKEK